MEHGVQVPDRAPELLERLTAELAGRDSGLVDNYPFAGYMAALEKYPRTARLGHVSAEVMQICAGVQASVGDSGLERYHRALLLALIIQAAESLPGRDMPDDIVGLFDQNFARIVEHIDSDCEGPPFYSYAYGSFFKDLAICTFRLIPIGAWKVQLSRLPRRMFVASGLKGGLSALDFVRRAGRGFQPYYCAHMHSQDQQSLREFNLKGWIDCYRREAALLRRNPEVKGHFGTGWVSDPALRSIAPHLAGLAAIPVKHGGGQFALGYCTPEGIKDATLTSATRRRLYEEGRYKPMDYVVIWPREELIAWVDSVEGLDVEAIRAKEGLPAPRDAARQSVG